jgi:hypothetical protein
MSDRAIPRSLRMMQGFGVHTFRLVNEAGESVFCKFHWNPKQGTHSLVWDEAVKMFRHGKTILCMGDSRVLLDEAGVPLVLPDGSADPGLVLGSDDGGDKDLAAFTAAVGKHRHPQRESDPPLV